MPTITVYDILKRWFETDLLTTAGRIEVTGIFDFAGQEGRKLPPLFPSTPLL